METHSLGSVCFAYVQYINMWNNENIAITVVCSILFCTDFFIFNTPGTQNKFQFHANLILTPFPSQWNDISSYVWKYLMKRICTATKLGVTCNRSTRWVQVVDRSSPTHMESFRWLWAYGSVCTTEFKSLGHQLLTHYIWRAYTQSLTPA